MKSVIALPAALAIFALVLVAGCASTGTPAPATPAVITPAATTVPVTTAPAAVATTAAAATTASEDTGTEMMPTAQQVNLDLSKDRPTSKIYLTYQGGPGEIFTQKVSMKVYATDGTVQEYVMSSGQKPLPNDQIIATGTRGGDRCIVYVQSAGNTYKVMDQKVYGAG